MHFVCGCPQKRISSGRLISKDRRRFLQAVMAEWLRRWTRNPMGFPRVGSNPAGSEVIFYPDFVNCHLCSFTLGGLYFKSQSYSSYA